MSFAWAGFCAAFGPIVLLSLCWRKLSAWGAPAGMVVATAVVVSKLSYKPNPVIDEELTAMVADSDAKKPLAMARY